MNGVQIKELLMFAVAYVTSVGGLVAIVMNYNKRKIEECRERSAGQKALEELREKDEAIKNKFDEFRTEMLNLIILGKKVNQSL